MNIAIVRSVVVASLIISATAASATVSEQAPRNIAASASGGGRVILAEDAMHMGKGGMGQSGGMGMGHGDMRMEMGKMPGGGPPAAAPQMGTSQQTVPTPPQCPPGTSLQMNANGQHLCK
jgi:hypothetical protein